MRELLGQALHDMTGVLASGQGQESRILRVLGLVQRIVPYETCALFRAQPGRVARFLAVPATPQDGVTALSEALERLFRQLVDGREPSLQLDARSVESHLVVPLVGNDEAIGVLIVVGAAADGCAHPYDEQHLRELSVVGSLLAGYLVMVEQARALDEARRDAERANRVKDELLARVSHELKAPLISTLAWAQMLRADDTGPSRRDRAVAGIERTVRTQAKLIDEMLDLDCIVAADLRLDREPVEPASLIEAAVEEQRAFAEQRAIRLETALDESVGRLIVDRARIVQVVSNLVAEAIQLAPRGGRVGIHLERGAAYARIRVVGHRAGRAACRGLAIASALVEAHGGYLRHEAAGEGDEATFTVELPLPADVPQARPREWALAGTRVLLVEDDDDMRIALTTVLEQHGAKVTGVVSAAAALEALEHSGQDVLLSDVALTGTNGYDLMRRVTALHPTLPAAALTTLGLERDRVRAAGFRMHLSRAADAQTLVASVVALAGGPRATCWR